MSNNGSPAHSIFQQGAGQVNAYAAVYNTETGCANQGMNIATGLDETQHYGGPANQDENGNYYLMDVDGYMWSGGYNWNDPLWNSAISNINNWVNDDPYREQ